MDQQQVIAALEADAKQVGLTIGEACNRAGLHPTTFSRWKLSERNPVPVSANFGSLSRLRAVIDAARAVATQEAEAA